MFALRSNRILFAAIGGFALWISPVLAADLPNAPPPAFRAPIATSDMFSGLWIGGEAGYGWEKATIETTSAPGAPDLHARGFVGGANLTYRWKFSPTGYLGITTALDYVDLSDAVQTFPGVSAGGKQDWLGTTGVQLGGTISPDLLVYASGGVAYGHSKSTLSIPALLFEGVNKYNLVGWYVGAGYDYAIAPNWTAGLEYKYVDFGNSDICEGFGAICAPGKSRATDNVVMLNLKLRLGSY